MGRFSLEDAKELVRSKGGTVVQEKDGSYEVILYGKKFLFKSGRLLVDYMRAYKEVDLTQFEEEKIKVKKNFDKYDAMLADPDGSRYEKDRAYRERRKWEKRQQELDVIIKAKGNPITPNRIARILKSAGLTTIETSTTAVRGWHQYYGDF